MMRRFKLIVLAGTAMLGVFTAPRVTAEAAEAAGASDPALAALVARGEYLAKASDCAGCHTAVGGQAYGGGLGLTSPFGTIMSSNITPDRRYGIGSYSYEDFARSVREGVSPGNKRLYPAMPYASFSKMSDDDMRALYAYFMHGVKPAPEPAPPTKLAFPFNQRWVLYFWQLAFAPTEPYRPKAGRDAQWNRGAFLVQGPGHCGACHTPRGPGFQERGYDESSPMYLTGGVNDNWFGPNLTGDPGSGLGRIGEKDLAAFLKTGHGAGLVAFGSMVEQVEDSTQYLTDEDALAMAHYLKSLPAQKPSGSYEPHAQPDLPSRNGNRVDAPQSVGARVYISFCARCHGVQGAGVPNVFPRLAGNPSVITEDTTSLIRLMVEGGNSPATISGPPRQAMPGFAQTLTNAQMANVLSWIRTSWGNDARPVTANDIQSLREKIHK
ncbi:MAG: Putative diheme cytochrome c-553 [uncultured Paraburkholderia sp.]|uniref:cytochrome c n=1 Tax=uncultured Paraburkholderia sp. TaxID=1822466 RepID=UPI00259172FF|nr:cytochrome c [uncultured Paraburkholderia sp.]CAH2895518.1 MAG: Putative diheme cytochrome c-553 [uncultured Paraburkholderia sp.]CAH2933275.1 MAG: Putative diheme cytochrome c-553 [uncultured Paraburkholderia sp.]